MWRKKTVLHVFVLIVICWWGGLWRAENYRFVWVRGLGDFLPPNKKLKCFCGNGLCFDKPSFLLYYEANFHSEDLSVVKKIWDIMVPLPGDKTFSCGVC